MDFNLTDDRRMLKESLSRFLQDRYGFETRNEIAGSEQGFSRELWAQMAELGLIGAMLPEEVGGFGGEGFDVMTVMEELGRAIVVEPVLPTAVLGAGILAEAGSDSQKGLLEKVISGELLLAFAHGEPQSRYSLSDITCQAERTNGDWVLDGQKAVVLNGDAADKIIVSARTSGTDDDEDGLTLFLIDTDAKGISRRGYATVDGGRAAEITLEDVAVGEDAVIGELGKAFPVIEEAIGRGILAVCAEALGAMDVAKDMTLEFLQTRKQFGVPLGKFQVLQHRMVEMCLEIEQARSATILAAGRMKEDRATREAALSAAKNLVGRSARLVAEESIQMHGGIGMTWEYALPHFAKRLTMIDHLFGDADHHLERFAALSQAS
ncbi:acyl-CoA dehydrogenase family protein [Denitrobaculum tricleocarpae]|uniref:Pimeloyl-CoA dehydrogenase small subunit n=1 Tax=Denitrobaculum tricleocarpae TaxID=2591009 RepID=A0A545U105_9PROT|nr:acyl-CoA dehydrogenase [Denitrobaculum tricleocarpae]TQV83160.1 pimeloyl-CoA dehydrogenase small subunit [Denitrobaculum tricleocarpae]